MLSLDITILYQIIGFLVLLYLLNKFLFRPVQKVMDERKRLTVGTLDKAENIRKEVEEGRLSYEKKLHEARLKGGETRQELKQEALEEEKKLIEAAGLEASEEISRMREKISEEKDAALKELTPETRSISREIASRLLERKLAILLITGILTTLPLMARAAEHAEEGGHVIDIWKVLNFLLLAGGLYYVWKKFLSKAIEKKQSDIRDAITEASRAKEEAEQAALKYRQDLDALESKLASIIEGLRAEGEAEKARIMEEATQAAERIRRQARITADQEIKKAKIEIREEVADLAVKLAAELLEKELGPEDQQRLIRNYISNLRLN